jgi:hypothetical protein
VLHNLALALVKQGLATDAAVAAFAAAANPANWVSEEHKRFVSDSLVWSWGLLKNVCLHPSSIVCQQESPLPLVTLDDETLFLPAKSKVVFFSFFLLFFFFFFLFYSNSANRSTT